MNASRVVSAKIGVSMRVAGAGLNRPDTRNVSEESSMLYSKSKPQMDERVSTLHAVPVNMLSDCGVFPFVQDSRYGINFSSISPVQVIQEHSMSVLTTIHNMSALRPQASECVSSEHSPQQAIVASEGLQLFALY